MPRRNNRLNTGGKDRPRRFQRSKKKEGVNPMFPNMNAYGFPYMQQPPGQPIYIPVPVPAGAAPPTNVDEMIKLLKQMKKDAKKPEEKKKEDPKNFLSRNFNIYELGLIVFLLAPFIAPFTRRALQSVGFLP